jgi:hypothetical protein
MVRKLPRYKETRSPRLSARQIEALRKAPTAALEGSLPTNVRIVDVRHFELWLTYQTKKVEVVKGREPKGVSSRLAFLLDLFLPPDRAEETLMGLEVVLETRWVSRYGQRAAAFICGCHVVATIGAYHWRRVVKLASFFGWHGDGPPT